MIHRQTSSAENTFETEMKTETSDKIAAVVMTIIATFTGIALGAFIVFDNFEQCVRLVRDLTEAHNR
jgi:hypothetical protein